MAQKSLLELGIVSAGVLTVVYRHCSQLPVDANTATYDLAPFVLFLLLAWYLQMLPWKPATECNNYRQGNGGGVWCSLILPMCLLIVQTQASLFLLMTIAVTFCLHISQVVNVSTRHKWMLMVGVSMFTCLKQLTLVTTVPAVLCGLVYSLLVWRLPYWFPRSFTLGEVAIVTQLLMWPFYEGCWESVSVGLLLLVAMTTLLVDKKIGRVILLVLLAGGLFLAAMALLISMALAMLLALMLNRLTFWNGDDLPETLLLYWWVICGIVSILFVCYHGYRKQTSPWKPSTDGDGQQLDFQLDTDHHGNIDNTDNYSKLSEVLKCETTDTDDQTLNDEWEIVNSDKDEEKFVQKCDDDQEALAKSNEVSQQSPSTVSEPGPSSIPPTKANSISMTNRKFFHFVMLAVYIPGLLYHPLMLVVASLAAVVAMFILEVVRLYKFTPIGRLVAKYFHVFVDDQDSGELILTPLYLLIGCSVPLWFGFYSVDNQRRVLHFNLYAGILSLGVGDTAASLVGRAIGKHRWPGSSKTVEGTTAAIVCQIIVICLLQLPDTGMQGLLSPYTVFAVVLVSLLEACTSHIDNLVVSLFAYLLFLVI